MSLSGQQQLWYRLLQDKVVVVSLMTNILASYTNFLIQYLEFVQPYQVKNITQYRGYCIAVLEILAKELNFR